MNKFTVILKNVSSGKVYFFYYTEINKRKIRNSQIERAQKQ